MSEQTEETSQEQGEATFSEGDPLNNYKLDTVLSCRYLGYRVWRAIDTETGGSVVLRYATQDVYKSLVKNKQSVLEQVEQQDGHEGIVSYR